MGRGTETSSILKAGLLVLALLAAPMVERASAGKSAKKARDQARSYVLDGTHRGNRSSGSQRIDLPVGPAYIYYDYPYYYSRGHYPTHIGGYVYHIPKSVVRCSRRKCASLRRASLSARRREACRCR